MTPETPEHPPCGKCRTTDPEAFGSPTSAFCRECWQLSLDLSHRFSHERPARWPFFIVGKS